MMFEPSCKTSLPIYIHVSNLLGGEYTQLEFKDTAAWPSV